MRRPSPGGGQGAALRPRCRDETWCRDDTCTGRPRLPCAARREPRAGRWSAPRRARRPDRADGTQMELHTRWGDVVGARLLVKWGSPELRRTSEASCEARKLKRADLGGDREQILLFLKKEVLHLYLFNLASEGICSKTVWSFPANQKRGCAHACVCTPACVHTPTCGQGCSRPHVCPWAQACGSEMGRRHRFRASGRLRRSLFFIRADTKKNWS